MGWHGIGISLLVRFPLSSSPSYFFPSPLSLSFLLRTLTLSRDDDNDDENRYRANAHEFRSQRWGKTFEVGGTFLSLREKIQSRHELLGEEGGGFPKRVPKRSKQLEKIDLDVGFESGLGWTEKSIIFVVPWL